jgi:hypothetical protein
MATEPGPAVDMGVLTEGWIRRAADVAVGTDTAPGSLAVQYVAEDGGDRLEHFQVFDGGRLVAWELGRLPEPSFGVVQSPDDQLLFVTGRLLGGEGMERTWIEEAGPDGAVRRLRPPPLDEADLDWSPLPEVPGATLCNANHVTSSPFGTVTYTGAFRDGKRVAWFLGEAPDADTTVTSRYALRMRAIEGLLTLPEMIEGGEVTGDWSKLMLLAGINETPEFRAVTRSGSGVRVRMALFAELVTTEPYRRVQAELARSSC